MTAAAVGLAGLTMLTLALAMSAVLGWASRRFHVEVDPRVESVDAALPGANCGGCGYIGCTDYAEAVVNTDADVALCAPGGPSCAGALAEIMGVEVERTWSYRAVVHCAATTEQRLGRHEYLGEQTCAAANVVSDVQGCVYGCLGLSDCVRSCDYDAIHVIDGLARVDYRKCTGCGACIDACPRHIISRIPFKAEQVLVVACSNQDFGADVKKVCSVGCIGCKACEKLSELIAMSGHLPEIDYEVETHTADDFSASIEKCPMESLIWVGTPSEKDLAATLDEELPERI